MPEHQTETHVSPEVEPTTGVVADSLHINGYEIQGQIGRGGMGKVYRARHLTLNRVVAIKVLTQEQDERLLARFREEARAVARLQHPNIAQLYDTGVADGRPYYSLEYADGGTVSRRWDDKPQDPHATATLIECVARAIQYSHEQGILHRDLKPGNVLLAADGTPKVADFGLAKELPTSHGESSTLPAAAALTRTGEIVGTPAYMPPEQASGVTSGLTPAADVYSLGAMLYEGLTGRPPFQAPDALQTLFMVLASDPVPPLTLQPKLPPDLNTICLKCLEKQPKKRYATAGELADDLKRWLSGEPIVARPVGRVERAVKWAKRHRAGAALIGMSAVFFLALVVFAVVVAVAAVRLRDTNTQLAKLNDDLETSRNELAERNAALEKSKAETETMLGYTLGTMDEYHFTLADKLSTLPQGEKLRVEVLAQAGRTLDEIYAANPSRVRVQEFLLDGYTKLGDARGTIGDLSGSETAYRRGREAAEKLVSVDPDNPRYHAAVAICELKLANTLETLGRSQEAVPLYEQGERTAERLERSHPNDPTVLQLLVIAYSRQGLAAAASGKVEDVVKAYQRWADLSHRRAAAEPEVEKYQIDAADWEVRLVSLLCQQMKFAEAKEILDRVKGDLGRLSEPDRLAVRKLTCAYHEAVGSFHYWKDEPAAADAAYRKAIELHEGLVRDFPDSPNYRRGLISAWTGVGNVWAFGGKPDDGLAAYKKARELAAALVKDYPEDTFCRQLLEGIDASMRNLFPKHEKP